MTDLDIKRRASELLAKGRYDEAVEEYQALLGQSKKPNPAILNLIGDIYCKQENLEKGFDCYLRAARAYADEGLFHNAIAVGKKILRFDRDQIDVYGMLGTLYARQGLGMDCVKFLNEFARRKDQSGEYPAALAAFADACERLPAFAELHVHYADMLERVNRTSDAAVMYAHAAQAFGDRGRADLAGKWSAKAKKLGAAAPPADEEEEENVAGLMNLRTLSDEAAQSAAIQEDARPESRPKPGAGPTPLELQRPESFWGKNDGADGDGVATAPPPQAAPPPAPAPSTDGIEIERIPSGPWKLYDPARHPNLPKPPPLPPRGVKRAVEPAHASLELTLPTAPAAAPAPEPVQSAPSHTAPAARTPSAEIIWEIPQERGPLKSEVEPAPEEDMVSTIRENPLRGSMRDLGEVEEPIEAANRPDPEQLRQFFDEPATSVEQAVVIGDDFELVREGGDVSEVIADFRDATREILDLDDHQAHYDLGTTYLEMELFDDAVAEFEIAARGNDFALPSQEMLGYCFLRKGQIDLAIRELEKALGLPGFDDRDRLGIHYNLGIACGVTDREAEAIEHFQKILEVDPNFRDTRSRLERLVQNSH